MNCARSSFASAVAILALGGVLAAAGQTTTQAPPMKSVLAGKKIIPPARGEVNIEFTSPVAKRVDKTLVTTIMVKNIGTAPIARLTVTETWYNDAGQIVSGNKGSIDGLLQPGEVKPVVVQTPIDLKMSRSAMTFSHANGTVKEKRVPKLVPTPAASPAPK